METVEITVERRTAGGKGAARQMRRTGKVPATLYGPKRSVTSVAVSALDGGMLEAKGISDAVDLMGALASLQITTPYGKTQPNFSLRLQDFQRSAEPGGNP